MSVRSKSCQHKKPRYLDEIDSFREVTNDKTMSQFINEILESEFPCLTKWNRNENTDEYDKIKKYFINPTNINDQEPTEYRYPHCWIIPEYKIDDIEDKYRVAFDFSFKIIIYHKNELYQSTFGATYNHISVIHQEAVQSNMFPTNKYPQVHPDVAIYHRTDALNHDVFLEDLYTVLEDKLRFDGPGKYLLSRQHKIAQAKHLDYYCIVLNKIFNCPGFAIQDILYNILNDIDTNSGQRLINTEQPQQQYGYYARIRRQQVEKINIDEELILLLKHKAFRKLKQWRHYLKCKVRVYQDTVTNQCRFKMYNSLSKKYTKIVDKNQLIALLNDTYHTVFVVSREDTFLVDHWAIIFEGVRYLLRAEFFHEDDIKTGFVRYQIFKNDHNGMRACWFSGKKRIKKRKQLFNERWSVISMTYLKKSSFQKDVNFKFIHDLVENIFMQDPKYFVTTNNCQIFVRNIYAVFDVAQAKLLNVKLQHRNMANAVPCGPVVVQVSEFIAMGKFIEDARNRVKDVKCVNRGKYVDILKILGQNVFVDECDYCEEKDAIDEYDENKSQNIDEESSDEHASNEENMNGYGNNIEEEIDINDMKSENGEEQHSDYENDDEKKHILVTTNKKMSIENINLETEAKKLLLEFEIPNKYIDNIIDNLKKEKFINIKDWQDLYDDDDIDYLVNEIGFKKPFAKRFKKRHAEWITRQNNNHTI